MCFHRAVPEDEYYSQCDRLPTCLQWVEEYSCVGEHLVRSRQVGGVRGGGVEGEGLIVISDSRLDKQLYVHVAAYRSNGSYCMHGAFTVLKVCGRATDLRTCVWSMVSKHIKSLFYGKKYDDKCVHGTTITRIS